MNRSISCAIALSLMLAPLLSVAAETTTTGCNAFTWNVSRELSLMAQPAAPIDVARERAAIRVDLDEHYLVHLAPQSSVKFALAPARSRNGEGAQAGLVRFRVDRAGRYRVALTSRHWIDVVDGDHAIDSRDFQGRPGCDRLHKVVEFELPKDRDLILQFSGDSADDVGLVISSAPKA